MCSCPSVFRQTVRGLAAQRSGRAADRRGPRCSRRHPRPGREAVRCPHRRRRGLRLGRRAHARHGSGMARTVGIPRSVVRCPAVRRLANLAAAASRLTVCPCTSPSHPLRRALATRSVRLRMICASRSGSGRAADRRRARPASAVLVRPGYCVPTDRVPPPNPPFARAAPDSTTPSQLRPRYLAELADDLVPALQFGTPEAIAVSGQSGSRLQGQ
jgi:hypothetical protein